jgi:hypothetical protein
MAYNRLSTYRTKIARDADKVSVVYHSTMIVRADAATLVLDAGGWESVTTKRKMNQASHQFGLGYTVHQHRHQWYVTTKAGEFRFDGHMVIDRATGLPFGLAA